MPMPGEKCRFAPHFAAVNPPFAGYLNSSLFEYVRFDALNSKYLSKFFKKYQKT